MSKVTTDSKLRLENADLRRRLGEFEKLFDFSGAQLPRSEASAEEPGRESSVVKVEAGVVISELPAKARRFYQNEAQRQAKGVKDVMVDALTSFGEK